MGIRVAFVSGPEESLGIKYLSAVLKSAGHQPELFIDPQLFSDEIISNKALARMFDSRGHLLRKVVAYKPQLIAFSVFTDFSFWAYDLSARLKKITDAPIIFGGIHPTSVPEEVISNKNVDMVCVGEGEYPLLELADSLDNGRKRLDIKNIWFKVGNEVVKNPVRNLVDLDGLPFADNDIYANKGRHFRIGYHTIASRGCPYSCSYCCHSILKRLHNKEGYYRVRKVDNLINEILISLKKYDFKIVRFYDDIFPYQMPWLAEFSEKYRERIKVPFICYLHPDFVNSERVLFLKKSGCVEIRLGVQSLNEDMRRNILNRHELNSNIRTAIRIIKESKINVITENILGLPGEKDEDMVEMLNFYNINRPSRNHFFWLRYYPGLEISKYRKDISGLGHKLSSRVFTQGGDTYPDVNRKLVIALYIINFLPVSLVRRILRYNIWKLFPSFIPVWSLNIMSNIASSSYSDRITRARAFKRYKTYLLRKR